ncbi:MAG: hypothetical protein AABX33_01270 [Nanoarchaeota archaeon]
MILERSNLGVDNSILEATIAISQKYAQYDRASMASKRVIRHEGEHAYGVLAHITTPVNMTGDNILSLNIHPRARSVIMQLPCLPNGIIVQQDFRFR